MEMKHSTGPVNAVLVTVDLADSADDADTVAAAIGVPTDAIDEGFGILLINPLLRRFAVKVDYKAFIIRSKTDFVVSGPYADPAIQPL